jgi:hypothetical protein
VTNFYSDRVIGPMPRTNDLLPELTAKGLVSLVETKKDQEWFAQRFPLLCGDGNVVSGTDDGTLMPNMRALIPNLLVPLFRNEDSDDVIFDLLEYSFARLSKPTRRRWHDYWRHYDLSFDEEAGRTEFRDEVDEMLARGGAAFQMTEDGIIERLGSREVREAVARLPVCDTADEDLEALIEQARALYFSRKAADRRIALEKLWDAFERLKTVGTDGDKLAGRRCYSARSSPINFGTRSTRRCAS